MGRFPAPLAACRSPLTARRPPPVAHRPPPLATARRCPTPSRIADSPAGHLRSTLLPL